MALYSESKQYLIDKLVASGMKSKVYTTEKALEKSQESHVGAVLFDSEAVLRSVSKTYYTDKEGARIKRRKVFDRKLVFQVVIGDYTDDAVEAIFEAFLNNLDRGIYVDGNFVPIEVEEVDWVNKDDSILKAQVAAQVTVTFDGGLYKDTKLSSLAGVEIMSADT